MYSPRKQNAFLFYNLQGTIGSGAKEWGKRSIYIRNCFSSLKSLLVDKKSFLV